MAGITWETLIGRVIEDKDRPMGAYEIFVALEQSKLKSAKDIEYDKLRVVITYLTKKGKLCKLKTKNSYSYYGLPQWAENDNTLKTGYEFNPITKTFKKP